MPEFEPDPTADRARGGVPGGRLMADALAAGGVHTIFTLCGGHILGLLDGCIDAGIRVIDVRHEGAASLAAEGWALATGSTGVAAVTAGPGFGNALTGFIDAAVSNVPLVLVAGRTGLGLCGRGAVMDVDQAAIVSPVAKAALSCLETSRIPAFTREALVRARGGRPGAVYLEVPQDVFMASADAIPARAPAAAVPAPDPADVERAVALLARAERPVIVAGGGAFWSAAEIPLAAFAERAGLPVTTTSAARGLIPDGHPLCLGSLVHAGVALPRADAVLVLGSAFNANLLYGRAPLFGQDQRVIQVDVDADRIGGERVPDVALVGDAGLTLRALTDAWQGPAATDAWLAEARATADFARASWDTQVDAHAGARPHAGAVAREVAGFARETGPHTFVADGGDALTWALAYATAEAPGRLLSTTTALGTLGVGMPFALAAAAARPDEPVFVFTGDGTFGLSAMEIDTAVRHGLPVIVVVSNNAGWRDVTHEQDAWFGPGRHVASELGDSRYDLVAQAFGGYGESVGSIDDLRPALKRALDAGVASVIDVKTDPAVLSELLRNMGSLGLM